MVQLCRESKMALTWWMPCCDNKNWLRLFIDISCAFPLRINAKEVSRIYIKVSVELWWTQALSCPAYLNLSFFLAYRISITDIYSQIHVLTLKNQNKPCFSSFLNLLSVFILSLCLCITSGTCFSLNAKGIIIQISASSRSLMRISWLFH